MWQKILQLFCITVCALPFASKIYAVDQFHSIYDVSYEIGPTGTTTVTQQIKLIISDSSTYPKGYTITIDSLGISNVVARDTTGQITPTLTKDGQKTTISLQFNKPVIGLGSVQELTVRFDDADIAKKVGAVWEVNLPPAPQDSSVDGYTAKVKVHPDLGPLAYVWPKPVNGDFWTKTELAHGITAAYGQQQVYEFTLSYFLANPRYNAQDLSITLPPDTSFQSVSIRSLEPLPNKLSVDPDGNWIATYAMKSRQTLDILATVVVETRVVPRGNSTTGEIVFPKDTQWDTTNPAITALATHIKSPLDVYKTVVEHLQYSDSALTSGPIRRHIDDLLAHVDIALCMQYTDLFVTLARASGIPARAVIGYAYTTDDRQRPLSFIRDVLHAWPEYYDTESKLWIPVDPTWADTTGGNDYFSTHDFNHVAFTIWGQSSDKPYPPGFYKNNEKMRRDIRVKFLTEYPEPVVTDVRTGTTVPTVILAGIPTILELELGNPSGTTVEIKDIRTGGEPFEYSQRFGTVTIPPFSQKNLQSPFHTPSLFDVGNGKIYFQVGEHMLERHFFVIPVFIFLIPLVMPFLLYGIMRVYRYISPLLWKKRSRRH